MSATFSVFQAGKWADLGEYGFSPHPGKRIEGKLFVGRELGLNGAEVSLNRMPAGVGMPFFHRHRRNEELYVFVGGAGEFWIDDERVEVREGTVVRVSPAADRVWRAAGGEDLYFLCIQYPATAEEVRETADGELSRRPLPW